MSIQITDGLTQASADARYVNVTGDTMTGILAMGTNPIRFTDSNGIVWELTVNTSGALVTTQISSGTTGSPIAAGFYMFLTYP